VSQEASLSGGIRGRNRTLRPGLTIFYREGGTPSSVPRDPESVDFSGASLPVSEERAGSRPARATRQSSPWHRTCQGGTPPWNPPPRGVLPLWTPQNGVRGRPPARVVLALESPVMPGRRGGHLRQAGAPTPDSPVKTPRGYWKPWGTFGPYDRIAAPEVTVLTPEMRYLP